MAGTLSKYDSSAMLLDGVELADRTKEDVDSVCIDLINNLTASAEELNAMHDTTMTVGDLQAFADKNSTVAELNTKVLTGYFDTGAALVDVIYYLILPFACTVTQLYFTTIYNINHAQDSIIAVRNGAAASMGSVTIGHTPGATQTLTPTTNNTFLAGESISTKITTAPTNSHGGSHITIICELPDE